MGRILVIDDNTDILDFFADLLRPLGHDVIRAHDGEEGLSRFHDELPDLVFLDLLLPRRDGSEVCAEIKRSEHGLVTPIVIMSGVYRNQSRIDVMRSYGAIDYLTKPMNVAKLGTLVDFALNGRAETDASPLPDPALESVPLEPGGGGAEPIAAGALARLLARAERERLSGVIVAAAGRIRRALRLDSGRIVAARSTAPADRLDRVLLSMRRTTPAQLNALRASGATTFEDALPRLIEMGLVNDQSRDDILRYQTVTVGLSMLRWSEGTCRMVSDEMAFHRLEKAIQPASILVLGLRRNPALRDLVGCPSLSEDAVFERPDPAVLAFAERHLTQGERQLLCLIDGVRSVENIRQAGALAELRVSDTLALLAGAGLVQPRAPGTSAGHPSPRQLVATGEHRSGDLADRSFAEVVGQLMRERTTGVLTITGRTRRSFTLADGEVVYSRSSDPADRLGQILLNEKLVDPQALVAALAEQRDRRPDKRLGALLVEAGALSLNALEGAMRRQALLIWESTFDWDEGAYAFDPADPDMGIVIRLGLPPLDLLRRGVARMDLTSLRRRWLEGTPETWVQAIPRGGQDPPEPVLHLSPAEKDVLDQAREPVAVAALASLDAAGHGRLRAVLTLLAGGLLALEERTRPQPLPHAELATLVAPRAGQPRGAGTSEWPAEPTAVADPADLTEVSFIHLDEEPARHAAPDRGNAAPPEAAPAGEALRALHAEFLSERRQLDDRALARAEELGALRERVRQREEEALAGEAALADLRAEIEDERRRRDAEAATLAARAEEAQHRLLAEAQAHQAAAAEELRRRDEERLALVARHERDRADQDQHIAILVESAEARAQEGERAAAERDRLRAEIEEERRRYADERGRLIRDTERLRAEVGEERARHAAEAARLRAETERERQRRLEEVERLGQETDELRRLAAAEAAALRTDAEVLTRSHGEQIEALRHALEAATSGQPIRSDAEAEPEAERQHSPARAAVPDRGRVTSAGKAAAKAAGKAAAKATAKATGNAAAEATGKTAGKSTPMAARKPAAKRQLVEVG